MTVLTKDIRFELKRRAINASERRIEIFLRKEKVSNAYEFGLRFKDYHNFAREFIKFLFVKKDNFIDFMETKEEHDQNTRETFAMIRSSV